VDNLNDANDVEKIIRTKGKFCFTLNNDRGKIDESQY